MSRFSEVVTIIEQNRKSMEFMATGFKKLDDFLDGGFLKKELVVLGAYTGLGKSYLAGNVLFNIAKQGFSTAYFSLEISNEVIVARLIGSLANIKPTRIMKGFLTSQEQEEKIRAKAEINTCEHNIDFIDNVYEFHEIEKIIKEKKYEFVVDFIQNIFLEAKDEYHRLSIVSLNLQRVAKQNNCCIFVLSQISNMMARDKSPAYEYKGSGSIATVCDLGFFLRRPEFIEKNDSYNTLFLDLKKNRRGISGIIFPLKFKQPGGLIYE